MGLGLVPHLGKAVPAPHISLGAAGRPFLAELLLLLFAFKTKSPNGGRVPLRRRVTSGVRSRTE